MHQIDQQKIKASIIVPVKNGGDIFMRVLDEVVAQDAPWPFDVIIIDSGSSDKSVEYANSLGVRVIEIEAKSFGHGRTRNLGASLTHGEFIVFITHDAMPADRHWLNNLVEACASDKNIAGAFGRHIAYPEASPTTQRELATHFAGFGEKNTIYRMEDPTRYANEEGYRQLLHFFSNNNACLRRSVWEEYPYPDVDFAEDQAWAKLIIEAGYSKAYAPDACVFHSHDFGIFETAQRAFDESRALHKLFSYVLAPSLHHSLRSWAYLTHRNMGWLKQDIPSFKQRWKHMYKVPFLALAKIAGNYAGSKESAMPDWVINTISRDKNIQRK